jgi:hypothetical protein
MHTRTEVNIQRSIIRKNRLRSLEYLVPNDEGENDRLGKRCDFITIKANQIRSSTSLVPIELRGKVVYLPNG